ncbi:MAG: prepilin peptidase [Planctomycetota bacterium]|jgi:leader peptidase (prepilin peptidase)/N-methyltransferase
MDVMWLIFLIALGASVGSFLNVVIWRLPRGESIVFPGSHCPVCGWGIRWHDNIPVLSWLILRGRCRFCGVRISPRYLLIELATAALVAGLFACYYLLDMRAGMGPLNESWLTFLAHAALVCALLACAAIDMQHWIVPLEVCWFVSLVGVAAGTIDPPDPNGHVLPAVSPIAGAMAVAAGVGLVVSLVLLRWGIFRPSFIDADTKVAVDREQIVGVAASAAHGVRPRIEVLHEVLFLTPPLALAAGVYLLAALAPGAAGWLAGLTDVNHVGPFARHLAGFEAALTGYLVGGLWIWGMRILGTLAFGREAMGMGDVHLLAAVGAVTGWIVPSVTFFVAPLLGLAWALWLIASRRQRELPYGPWLAVSAVMVMVFHDPILAFLRELARAPGR